MQLNLFIPSKGQPPPQQATAIHFEQHEFGSFASSIGEFLSSNSFVTFNFNSSCSLSILEHLTIDLFGKIVVWVVCNPHENLLILPS